MRKYWYTGLLSGSLILAAAVVLPDAGAGQAGAADAVKQESVQIPGESQTEAFQTEETSAADSGASWTDETGESPAEESQNQPEETGSPGGTDAGADTQPQISGTASAGAVGEDTPGVRAAGEEFSNAETAESNTEAAGEENFSNVLFIGDSRTVGLSEYGDLGEAQVFANTGMSVFNLMSAEETMADGEKMTLEQLLSTRSFRRIYLMLGINELGYPRNEIVTKYRSVVARIQELQPDAYLILEGNLHVTQEKSAKSPVYGNDKINELNREIWQIAVDTGCGYLDANVLFDDATGSLSAEYSTDGSHILGKYYREWVQWLKDQP